MSTNIPKKLQVKAELLRHLDTAMDMMESGKQSSEMKVATLYLELGRNDAGKEVNLQFWDDWLGGKDMASYL